MERPNNLEALITAFETHRARLARLVERHLNEVLKKRLSVDDVLQEAMVNVSHWGGDFAFNADLPVYFRLRSIVLRTLTRLERFHLKAQCRDAYREVEPVASETNTATADVWDNVPATLTSPLSVVAREDRHALLHRAVQELSSADKQIIILRNFDDLSNSECAQILGLDVKAASIRYVRALQRLKAKLVEWTEFQSS